MRPLKAQHRQSDRQLARSRSFLEIQTTDDARQAIFLLELANNCIRLIIGQTNLDEEIRKSLLAQSAMIDMRIETARRNASILKN
ncbi:hypothetical protein QA640_45450 (plasmid) [Bradyrhizobium sp. CB82]|uniref:hypothetical protein n=1 Tax=Bradyrhizobium sp. CB82 TaxID=3039159 RepID=UPI0024B24B14|nr:hypothetical protein [Bradyrhizobium sp. CB82]WFU46018.1 hypothetical protein QA640_45450 [Bradyrhizobium sp. CB82]